MLLKPASTASHFISSADVTSGSEVPFSLYEMHQDCFGSKPHRHMAERFLLLKADFTGSPAQGSSSFNNDWVARKIIQSAVLILR